MFTLTLAANAAFENSNIYVYLLARVNKHHVLRNVDMGICLLPSIYVNICLYLQMYINAESILYHFPAYDSLWIRE